MRDLAERIAVTRHVVQAALLSAILICSQPHLQATDEPLPTEFYIVSEVTSDASPFWFHYVLQVAADGHDSVVRYTRIAPMDPICADATTVQAATARLSGVAPSQLAAQYNLCAVNSDSLGRLLERQIRKAAVDDSVRFSIVANCGSKETVLRFPYPEQVNLERLRKRSPELARWWDLSESIVDRAFGGASVFRDPSAEHEEELQREGETMVPEFLSGHFDPGLYPRCPAGKPCTQRSFRDELSGYVGQARVQDRIPTRIQIADYQFKHYVPAKYPVLAIQARISGTVKLELTVDSKIGTVREVSIISGHPLFRKAVIEAARQWQFLPEQLSGESQNVPAELVFEFRP